MDNDNDSRQSMNRMFVSEVLADLKDQAEQLGQPISEIEADELGQMLLDLHETGTED